MKAETSYQTDVKHAVEEAGGYGLKLSNRFLLGIPDLLVKLPDYEAAALIEVKLIEALPRGQDPVKFKHNLTELQKGELQSFRDAGGPAGVIAFANFKDAPTHLFLLVITDWNRLYTKLEFQQCSIRLPFRAAWPQQIANWLRPIFLKAQIQRT